MIPEGEYEVQKVLDNRLTTCKQESWPMYYLHFKCFEDNISYSILIFINFPILGFSYPDKNNIYKRYPIKHRHKVYI